MNVLHQVHGRGTYCCSKLSRLFHAPSWAAYLHSSQLAWVTGASQLLGRPGLLHGCVLSSTSLAARGGTRVCYINGRASGDSRSRRAHLSITINSDRRQSDRRTPLDGKMQDVHFCHPFVIRKELWVRGSSYMLGKMPGVETLRTINISSHIGWSFRRRRSRPCSTSGYLTVAN